MEDVYIKGYKAVCTALSTCDRLQTNEWISHVKPASAWDNPHRELKSSDLFDCVTWLIHRSHVILVICYVIDPLWAEVHFTRASAELLTVEAVELQAVLKVSAWAPVAETI